MTCLIETGFNGDAYDMTYPRICWRRWAGGTITATTEATGFDADNAATPRVDSFWKPTSLPGSVARWTQTFTTNRTIGYIGIAAHDLADQNATIKVQYQIGAGGWTDFNFSSHTPTNNDPIVFLVDPITISEYRVVIESADDNPYIGVIFAGNVTEVPQKATWTGQPITEGDQITFADNMSDSGVFLGRTLVSDGLQHQAQIDHLSETWRSSELAEFKAHANGAEATFFYVSRPGSYPNELLYGWCDRVVTASRELPNASIANSVTLRLRGYRKA